MRMEIINMLWNILEEYVSKKMKTFVSTISMMCMKYSGGMALLAWWFDEFNLSL